MSKKVVWCGVAVLFGLSVILTCQAAAPIKVSSVAPIADLVTEAELTVKLLDEDLATQDAYASARARALPRHAGLLATVAQAIAESDEKPSWKASAADVRDGALAISASKTYDEAKKGLAAIKDAAEGKKGSAKTEAEWNKLFRLNFLMTEVNTRNTKMLSAQRKTALPDDTSELARHSSVLAVLALAAHDDTHEVKDKAQIPVWQGFAKDYSTQMTAAAAALKKKDREGFVAAYTKAKAVCADCHAKFKDSE